jgi:hypothetical protein
MRGACRTPHVLAGVTAAVAALLGRAALAEEPPPVDVAIHEPRPPRRVVAVEFNPLSLIIGRLSANVVVAPTDHYSLILSPFYAWATTQPIYVSPSDGSGPPTLPLPTQHFSGFGSELGYRYYFGRGGPRGFFVGPSLIAGWFTATAQNGSQLQYLDYGLAADVGYEMLVADRVALSLGGGLQYTTTSKSLPNQQFPAEIYANAGLRPRVLLSCGWAF